MANLIKLDPEFEAAYRGSDGTIPSNETDNEEDDFQVFRRMAEENRKNGIDRKQFASGSFDQIEADATNIGRLFFDFMTRPLKE